MSFLQIDNESYSPLTLLVAWGVKLNRRARGWHVSDSGIVVIAGERSTVPVAALVI
jgi:hypothetical protein